MTDITWTNCTVRLGDLKPWEHNPRTSSKAQARRILKSFEQFGQVAPIAVGPSFEVYDGHQRLSALLTIHGPDFEVEARQSSKMLSDDERRGLVLALANATGSWNWDSLSNWDTSTLTDWGFDKDTLKGWKSDVTALGEFLKSEAPAVDAEPQTDRAAELLEKWQVQPGDLWLIGEHRLICGDCTDAATVARVMDGEEIELFVSDPPYGMEFVSNYRKVKYDEIAGDDAYPVDFLVDVMEKVARAAYLFCRWNNIKEMPEPKSVIAWVKNNWSMGDLAHEHGRQWEACLFYAMGRHEFIERIPDVIDARRTGNDLHPTEKPVDLIQKIVGANVGEVVADFFSGSGTTLVACENLRRRCRAIEISPAYVAVALERMSQAFPSLPIRRAG